MFKGTSDLAENKLLLLYIFQRVNMPMNNSHITQIVLENNLINYFGLQQYLSELVEAGFLKDNIKNKKHILSITSRGTDSLEFFHNRIPEKRKDVIDKYLDNHMELIKKDIGVVSEFDVEGNNSMLRLTLKNNETTLMELKFPVENNSAAQEISQHWKENYDEIYSKIMNIFIK
jgi:predicted transcriptional regulator